jgi:hypothetical protein
MDQPNNNNMNKGGMNHGQGCTCGMCGGYYTNGHRMGITLLRWLLGIIVILMVFSLGVSIGEFKGEVMGGGMMYRHNMMYGNEMPMMVTGSAVATPVTTTTTK